MTKMIDPFDELAAMFLSAPTPTTSSSSSALRHIATNLDQAPSARSASPGVAELLLAGNLPVRGALWLTPYADAIARQAGTVALIRLDSEQPSVQILRGPEELASAPLGGTLAEAIARIATAIDLWMIVPRAGDAGAALLAAAAHGCDRITILSSADEAAVVAAYQTMKTLVQAADDQHGSPGESGSAGQSQASMVPPIGLAVVGCDPATAAGVIERLNRTTVSFLGVEVGLRLALPRMDAGIKSTRFANFASVADLSLSQVMNWIDAAKMRAQARPPVAGRLHAEREQLISDAARLIERETATAEPMDFRTFRMPSQIDVPPVVAATRNQMPPVEPRTAPLPPMRPSITHTPPIPNEPRSWTVKLSPKPARLTEPKNSATPIEPDDSGRPVSLSSYVEGLISLPIRAPNHERVELAIDAQGRIHLLMRDAGGAQGDADPLRELRIVEAWARLHRELIALACPQPGGHRFDFASKIVAHVFTSEPANVCDLYGSGVRPHLLTPVTVKGQVGWYAAALNKE